MSTRILAFSTLVVSLALFPGTVSAQFDCGPDLILAKASGDTIFVQHLQAERNCCTDLTLRMEVAGEVVDFYEGDGGDWCYCICCFELAYDANGFAPGQYLVRVWNEDGSELYGEADVEVPGSGMAPQIGSLERGDCLTTADTPDGGSPIPITWGAVRARYR